MSSVSIPFFKVQLDQLGNTSTFLLVKIEFDETKQKIELDEVQIQIIINNSLVSLFGELGMIGATPKVLKYNRNNKNLIIECADKNTEKLRQALFLTDGGSSLGNGFIKVSFKVLNETKFISNIDVCSRNDFF